MGYIIYNPTSIYEKLLFLTKYLIKMKLFTLPPTITGKAHITFRTILLLSLFFFSCPVIHVYSQDIRQLKVRKGHPTLFVTPEMVQEIRTKQVDLASFHNYVKTSRMKLTNDPSDTIKIRQEVDDKTLKGHIDYYINDCMCYGVDAFINQDPLAKAYARQYVLSLLDRPISGDDDMPIRGKLFALGVLYDFLYDDLEPSLKKKIRNEILDMVHYVDSKWHYISHANAGGHSRFGNISALVGLLPIYHDIEPDNASRYFNYLGYVVSNWKNIFNPLQEWVNGGGSHSMGWAYGASYSTFYPYMAWEFATDEASWFTDWQKEKPYFNLYGLRNDYNEDERNQGAYDNFPFWEDVWSSEYSPNLQGLQVLFSAGYFGDKHAQWFYNHMKKRNLHGWMFDNNPWDILYRNFSSDAGTPPEDLPLSRFFPHSGFVVMRDSWDFKKNTLMVFKSSSFYAAGHHHKDQNAFTIYYKGPLAIDAGTYEACGGWGSIHFWNYYTRSVAHNTMLIYDPSESFNGYSNDGGQRFFPIDDPSYEDVIEGGANHLDGIIHYENNPTYTYTAGDATKAYSSNKLTSFVRSIVYLRNYSYGHPAMIVYDKVISKKAGYKKTYLLHSIREPAVDSNLVTINIDDGMNTANKAVLFQQTLLPKNAMLVKIGGRENDQQFYVADDGHGQPHNYDENANYNTTSQRYLREFREGGEWRVEVSPSDTSEENEFLHVLSVTDGKEGVHPLPVKYISSDHIDGVIVSDENGLKKTVVLFCRENESLDDTVGIPDGIIFQDILITGLKENTKYVVERLPAGIHIKSAWSPNLESTDQGTLWLNESMQPILARFTWETDPCRRAVQFNAQKTRSDITGWVWDFGDGQQATLQKPLHQYDTAGTYSVTLIATRGTNEDTLTREITVPPVIRMPQTADAVRCGPGTLTLVARGDTGILYWYDDPEGGNIIASGDTFTTPFLDETKLYYAANVLPGTPDTLFGAKRDTSGGGGYYPWDDEAAIRGLIFDVHKPVILQSVKVYNDTGQAAVRTIAVSDAHGELIASKEVYIPAGISRIELGFHLDPGNSYFLKAADPHKGLYRNSAGISFPYNIGEAVTIQSSDVGTDYYYFFYDWEIIVSGDSSSCRSIARAVITYPPVANFRQQVYDTVVYFVNNSTGESYLWDFGDGITSTEKDPVHFYMQYGTYPVKLTVTNDCGADSLIKTVEIVESPQTGVSSLKKESLSVLCYPNPARDIIYFHTSYKKPGKETFAYVHNNAGSLIRIKKIINPEFFSLDITNLPPGIYILRLASPYFQAQPVRFVVIR